MATKKRQTAATNAGIDQKVARALDALRTVDPGQWRDKILAAFREKKGNAVQAATVLGVSHRSVLRYMEEDEVLAAAIEKTRGVAAKEREQEKKREAREEAERKAKAKAEREAKAQAAAAARAKSKRRSKRSGEEATA